MAKLAHMKRDAEEKHEMMEPKAYEPDDYPSGLRIYLTEAEMEKCGMEMPKVGDLVHFNAMCKVVRCSESSDEQTESSCCDLQITHLSLEDEDDEEPSEAASKLYPKK